MLITRRSPFMYAISLGLALTPICFSTLSAQERCKVSEEATAAKSSFTQQHVLDVGDVSGHQIRVFELHRTASTSSAPSHGPEVIPTTSIAMAEPGDTR